MLNESSYFNNKNLCFLKYLDNELYNIYILRCYYLLFHAFTADVRISFTQNVKVPKEIIFKRGLHPRPQYFMLN